MSAITPHGVWVKLVRANFTHSHIYLSGLLDFFPSDAIGGTNKASAARNPIKVIFSTGEAIEVDLPKDKKFLRARAPIRKFFKDSKAEPGDIVLISRIGKRQFKFDLVKS